MAIIRIWAEDVAKPGRPDPSGFRKGDARAVYPDGVIPDGYPTIQAYLAAYPKRALILLPGMPEERAWRCVHEEWTRAPVLGDHVFDAPDNEVDDNDRIIKLGERRWLFNMDPDNDPEPDNATRTEMRNILNNEHWVIPFDGRGSRPAQLNPWFYDHCKSRVDTLVDVDDFDVPVAQRKSPERSFKARQRILKGDR